MNKETDTTKLVLVGAGALAAGSAVTSASITPDVVFKFLDWFKDNILLGVLIFTNGIAWGANWLFWIRLKEKDFECHSQLESSRSRWSAVVEKVEQAAERRAKEAREDRLEMAKRVGELASGITILIDRRTQLHSTKPQ